MTSPNDGYPDSPMQLLPLYYLPAFFCRYEYRETSESNTAPSTKTPDIQPIIYLWSRHPAEIHYNPDGAFSINLHHTPQAWLGDLDVTDIAIDDHTNNGGHTTIGPFFPHAYGSGGMYISKHCYELATHNDENVCKKYGIRPRPPMAAADETVLIQWIRSQESRGQFTFKRYHGFFGIQLGQASYPRLWIVWHSGTWKSDQPHMNRHQHWRAPQKLWIPDIVNLEAQGAFAGSHDSGQSPPEQGPCPERPIYLEQTYATYVANLDVPKQPSASGERIQLSASVFPRPYTSPRPSTRTRSEPLPPNLNIISEYAPGEIYLIKNKLDHYLEVMEGETIVDALSGYLEGRVTDQQRRGFVPQFTNLDIIGHSRSRDRVLKVGEFALTSRIANEQFQELYQGGILRALGIKAIRLLGCRTAAPPRGEHVVRTIWNQTGLDVYATRTDLFAVHFDGAGLRREAEVVLANYDVVTRFGAGDLPPREDYPANAPLDDDDDDDDSRTVRSDPPPPDRFALTALSAVNAAAVSANDYLFWQWAPWQFDELAKMLYGSQAERDNRLRRAEYEVLLPIVSAARDISDFRSFDLFLGAGPRLRVNYDGVSYAFRFKLPFDQLRGKLCDLGIHVALCPKDA
jgi:hypothetical protein